VCVRKRRRHITLKTTKYPNCLPGFLFAVVSLFCFGAAQIAFAGASDNVHGFAWVFNEGIGWVSLNSTNCDKNGSGVIDAGDAPVPAGCPAVGTSIPNYGVTISEDGKITGYAWSGVNSNEGIGWISFNAEVNGPGSACPSAPCQAYVEKQTGVITGWARALAACDMVSGKCSGVGAGTNAGGWDGWIKLKGKTLDNHDYGWTVDTLGTTHDFHGYAFGSSNFGDATNGVIGWASANCLEGHNGNSSICAVSPYKVWTDAAFGPDAIIGCGGTCINGGVCGGALWELYPPTGCSDSACMFQFKNMSTPEETVKCSYWQLTGPASYSYTAPLPGIQNINLAAFVAGGNVVPGNYNLTLTVSDKSIANGNNQQCTLGNHDSATQAILITGEAQARFKCSLDNPHPTQENPHPNPSWADCNSTDFKKKVIKGEMVYVSDDNSSYSGGAHAITSRDWKFTIDGAVTNTTGDTASFTAGKSNTIDFRITDNKSRSGCKSAIINAKNLPKWREVSPVSMIWQYLAATVSNFFATL